MRAFCCNKKCQYHATKVDDSVEYIHVTHLKPVKPPANLSTLAVKPSVPSFALQRHQIGLNTGGMVIEDFLCDVCIEVFKMVDPH